MKQAVAATLAALVVTACIPQAELKSSPDPAGACSADHVQEFIGQTLTEDLAKKLQRKAGAKVIRVAHKDGVITMDYNVERLNIFHDDAKVITRVNCG